MTRFVSTQPNRHGLIELGPCDKAFGLGDTLTITPVARALGKRAVMLMPESMEKLSFLFYNLCPVKLTDDFPVFPWRKELIAVTALKKFGLSHLSPIPSIDLRPGLREKARDMLKGYTSPIAFCPTCSRGWAHIRQRPAFFWKQIVAQLAKRYTVLQFGFTDYPLIDGAVRFPFVDLETLAAIYREIGNYVGVDTGDYHLMLAVGGRAVIAEPDPMPKMERDMWTYRAPTRVQAGRLSHPHTVMDAIQKLKL